MELEAPASKWQPAHNFRDFRAFPGPPNRDRHRNCSWQASSTAQGALKGDAAKSPPTQHPGGQDQSPNRPKPKKLPCPSVPSVDPKSESESLSSFGIDTKAPKVRQYSSLLGYLTGASGQAELSRQACSTCRPRATSEGILTCRAKSW